MNSLDERYGSTYRIRAFATELKKRGHEISFYEKSIPFPTKFVDMIRTVLRENYDVLILQKFNPLTLIPMILAKFKGKYLIVDWDDWDTGLQKNILLKFATWICEKVGPHLPDLITSHNEFLLNHVPPSRPRLRLDQGFDDDLFQNGRKSENRTAYRKKYGYKEEDIVIGYVCTFTHGGTLDLDQILRQFSNLSNQNLHIAILGGGKLLPSFENLAKKYQIERIRFLGHVDHANIPRYLQMLDLGLIYMTEKKANQSRVSFKVIEYLAAGIPVMGQATGETQRLFGEHIQKQSLGEIHQTLQSLQKTNLPPRSTATGLLNNFAWSNIMIRLDEHLQKLNRHEKPI